MKKPAALLWILLLMISTFSVPKVFVGANGSNTAELSYGLVAYYSFDHCDARDDSDNGHDGVIYGNPKCVDGILGKAFEFDGSSYIRVSHSDDLAPPCYTVSVWFNPFEESYRGQEIVSKGYNKLYYQIQWGGKYADSANEVEFWLEDESDADAFVYSPRVSLNTWHMATMVYCDGVLKGYIDGKLVNSTSIDIVPYNSGESLYIAHGDNGYFKGLVDEVRIYNRALSDEEIRSLYLTGAGSPSLPSRYETPAEYKYVFPLTYLKPLWGTSWYGSGIVVYSTESTVITVDANFNGPDASDPKFQLSPGERLYIGEFPDVKSPFKRFKWNANPLVMYSTKPIFAQFYYSTADYGDYDDAYMTSASPIPGTKLLGANVRWLYITTFSEDARVYINGKYAGSVNPGKVIVKNFSTPTTVVVTSDSPVVAMAAYADPNQRSRTYVFPLMPPMTGKFLIPNSEAQYAEERNALDVREYYVVMDSEGRVVTNSSLPENPEVLNLKDSAVFVFRTFYYKDPWGSGAPRYAMSAAAIKPVGNSTLFGFIYPVGRHTVDHELVFYAEDDVKVYRDINIDGTVDSVETLPGGRIYWFSDRKDNPESSVALYVVGRISGEYLALAGWSGHIEGSIELGASPIIPAQRTQTILGHNVTILQKVQSNQSSEVISNETASVEFTASAEIYRVEITVNGEEKEGYLVLHNVTVRSVRGNVEVLRTIYNVSKDVAYSVDDMILSPEAIIIQREPVIALDIKDPKEGESVNQTVIILTDVPESELTKGIKITHEIITEERNTRSEENNGETESHSSNSKVAYVLVGLSVLAGVAVILMKKR